MEPAPVSLVRLNTLIKSLIKNNLGSYWLTAEISELTENYSGHCYLEFVQKDEKSEKLLARSNGTIWANTYRMVKPYFETTTGRPFSEGIKVMVRVTVNFHEVYGLSLNVIDIEPTYTVGEIAIRKQKILEKLKAEGVIDMNKELDLSYVPNRLAVISSTTAAGFEDFADQLIHNQHGYKFYIKLFPAVMQGSEAESSIIGQLDKIFAQSVNFDAVVVIRGGGSQADLECFNSYWLAYHVAQFPLPVLTGIGHEQDDSVVDIVANTRLKTPTAVAEFLIDCMASVENDLLDTEDSIVTICRELIETNKANLRESAFYLHQKINALILKENKRLSNVNSNFISQTKNKIYSHNIKLDRSQIYLGQKVKKYLAQKSEKLSAEAANMQHLLKMQLKQADYSLTSAFQKIELINPRYILNKGYSITTKNGSVIKDSKNLASGDEIETTFSKGKTKSIIK